MTVLASITGAQRRKADLGYEIEVEFEAMPPPFTPINSWQVKSDGSLRGAGFEFVSTPMLLRQRHERLTRALNIINQHRPIQNCPRTSVHVHINCLDLTPLQIITGLCFGWLIEDSLLDLCGKSRRGNRFCLTIRDAPILFKNIQSIIDNQQFNFRAHPDRFKYANIAYHNLQNIGTIEFRGMEGRYDVEYLDRWGGICYNTIHGAAQIAKNPIELFEKVLSNPKVINEILQDDLRINQEALEYNYDLLYMLVYGNDWDHFTEAVARYMEPMAGVLDVPAPNPIAIDAWDAALVRPRNANVLLRGDNVR